MWDAEESTDVRGEAREKIFSTCPVWRPSVAVSVSEEGEWFHPVTTGGAAGRTSNVQVQVSNNPHLCGVGVPWFPVRNGFVRSVRAARGDGPDGNEWTVRRGDLCLPLPACAFSSRDVGDRHHHRGTKRERAREKKGTSFSTCNHGNTSWKRHGRLQTSGSMEKSSQ